MSPAGFSSVARTQPPPVCTGKPTNQMPAPLPLPGPSAAMEAPGRWHVRRSSGSICTGCAPTTLCPCGTVTPESQMARLHVRLSSGSICTGCAPTTLCPCGTVTPESQMAPMGLNVTQPGQWACCSAPRPPAVAAGTHRPATAHVGHAQTRDVYADPRCSHIRASHPGPAGPAVDPEVSQLPQRQHVLNIPKSNPRLMADLIK
ncbi:hypothetical protein MDA_GLEAN10005149 [Myotis davidii]|uniref:Uncharacterized protein n=1 Tax=Myotis davidii TaxID=225400 RepID=L5M8D0_MYODS|nr:hypothetical protein MDA_GLEAN10005149 [Myotis davidii]